jgi:hypothetical protein
MTMENKFVFSEFKNEEIEELKKIIHDNSDKILLCISPEIKNPTIDDFKVIIQFDTPYAEKITSYLKREIMLRGYIIDCINQIKNDNLK